MPKSVLDKVRDAIETLAEPGGASRPAIAKAVKAQHGEVGAPLLKKALAQGVTKGLLVQTGQRFALVGVEIAARPDETVESEMLKAGAGESCSAGDEVTMSYVGTLESDGSCFDKAKSFSFTLGGGVTLTPPAALQTARTPRLHRPPRWRSRASRAACSCCTRAGCCCAGRDQGLGPGHRRDEGRRAPPPDHPAQAGLRAERLRQGHTARLDADL